VIAQVQIGEGKKNPPHELKYFMVFGLATTQVQKLSILTRLILKGHTPKILYYTIFGFVMMKVLVFLLNYMHEMKNLKIISTIDFYTCDKGETKIKHLCKMKIMKITNMLDFLTNDITKIYINIIC
jgi:hypothetical protein